MTKDDSKWQDDDLGDPAAISFSDDETTTHAGADDPPGAAKYFEEPEDAADDTDMDEHDWAETPELSEPKMDKPPFYRRPIFYLVLLVVVVLAGSLAMSLSKQKKRKAVHISDTQQFSQPAPAIPIEAAPPVAMEQQPPAQALNQEAPVAANPGATTVPSGAPGTGLPQSAPQLQAAPVAPATNNSAGSSPQPSQQSAEISNNDRVALENRMKKEILALSNQNTALQREVRLLNARVDRLTKAGGSSAPAQQKTVSSEKTQTVAPQPAPVVDPLGNLSIKAIRKGQAWVASPGGTYTVNVGDMLPGNIRVTGIDPENLEVATSVGIIRYRK